MPTYEYECAKCKKDFEIFQSMKDDALTVCPKEKCRMKTWGKGKVKRKLGVGAGFIFKGSGFYITDYRSEGYKKSKSDASTAASDSKKAEAHKPDSKADTKPAAKPAASSD
jgi:putative FmdB family regulatory protein